MKTIVLTSFFLFYGLIGLSQAVDKSSIDSGGASVTNGNLAVLYSIGEVHVNEVNAGSLIVSEGFIGPFQNCDINAIEAPQDLVLNYDGFGNTIEVDEWLNDFEFLVVNSSCNFSFGYHIINTELQDSDFDDIEDTLRVELGLDIFDNFGNSRSITAFIIFNDFAGAGFENGNGDAICDPFFDLNNIESGVDYTDAKYSSSNFNIVQVSGKPGATSSGGTTVQFPDTGAGQFTYSFSFAVETSFNIGTESVNVESSTQYTANLVTVAFEPGPNITVERCDFNNIDLLQLYEELQIQLDVDTSVDQNGFPYNEAEFNGNVFEPENLWYNETDDLELNPNTDPLTEITEPGTYQFNAKAFLADCAGEPVFVTIVESCDKLVDAKVILQGASINTNPGEENLMRDDLRGQEYLPTLSPYPDALACDPSVFNIAGVDAIVDWIWVELRDANDNTSTVASRSALLQRDGDVVDIDGVSSLGFDVPEAAYFIVVNHRNHFGVMTSVPINLNTTLTTVDFTDTSTETFGTNARATLSDGSRALWAGDVNGDGLVNFSGDVNSVLVDIILFPTNTTFSSSFSGANGYLQADVKLDGNVGFSDEINQLLLSILFYPLNTTFSTSFNLFEEQLPSPSALRTPEQMSMDTMRLEMAQEIIDNQNKNR
jgi:hypothetical protein